MDMVVVILKLNTPYIGCCDPGEINLLTSLVTFSPELKHSCRTSGTTRECFDHHVERIVVRCSLSVII